MNTGSRGVNSAVWEEGGTSWRFSSQMPMNRSVITGKWASHWAAYEQIDDLFMKIFLVHHWD